MNVLIDLISREVSGAFEKAGFDPAYGARPLRRCICTDLEDPAADALLNGTVSPGDLLVADARDGKLVLEVR